MALGISCCNFGECRSRNLLPDSFQKEKMAIDEERAGILSVKGLLPAVTEMSLCRAARCSEWSFVMSWKSALRE